MGRVGCLTETRGFSSYFASFFLCESIHAFLYLSIYPSIHPSTRHLYLYLLSIYILSIQFIHQPHPHPPHAQWEDPREGLSASVLTALRQNEYQQWFVAQIQVRCDDDPTESDGETINPPLAIQSNAKSL
jgi:hypothetical protein